MEFELNDNAVQSLSTSTRHVTTPVSPATRLEWTINNMSDRCDQYSWLS